MDVRFSERRMGKEVCGRMRKLKRSLIFGPRKPLQSSWKKQSGIKLFVNKYLNDPKKLDTTRTGLNAERNSRT